MAVHSSITFPPQKKLDTQKTEKWLKQCVDSAEQVAIYRNDRLRMNYRNKRANYLLMMNQIDPKDMTRIANPYGLDSNTFPANMQNYPIVMPRINVLVGEELKRRFDWNVRVQNDNAVNRKQEAIKAKVMALAEEALSNENLTKEDFQKEMAKLEKWKNYSFKDIRELEANNILKYLYEKLDLKTKFNSGFEDVLIAGEESFAIDIIGNDVDLSKLNPLTTFVVGKGNSKYFEHSDLIVIDDYIPIGTAIDKYHDELTDKQIDGLENGITGGKEDGFISIGEREPSIIVDGTFESGGHTGGGGQIEVGNDGAPVVHAGFNDYGEVRETRVYWKSRRKLLKLKYYDDMGDEQLEYVDERYEANEAEGESIDGHIWINEWYQGVRLGVDYYLKMGPREFQIRDMDNPSICNPGIIGTVFTINTNTAISFLDIMKPYQYLYNTFMYRTELAMAKSHGKMMRIDPSLIPDGMEMDEWMYYVTQMGFIIEDPYTEANQDDSTANLAQLSRGAREVNLDNSAYIQQHISMMQYIDEQCGRIAGVTMQREGQISTSDTVGGTERSVMQSNSITEKYFFMHDNVKLRVLAALLEAAKYAWRNLKTKKLQYTTSDMATYVFDVDVEEFSESNYNLFVSNSQNDEELMQSLKSLAQAGIQNDKLNFSQLMDIYMSPSIADVRRKIEADEAAREQAAQEQAQAERDAEQQAAETQAQGVRDAAQAKIDFEAEQNQLDRDHEMAMEQLRQMGNIYDKGVELDKLAIQDDKQNHELEKQKREHAFKAQEAAKERALKRSTSSSKA